MKRFVKVPLIVSGAALAAVVAAAPAVGAPANAPAANTPGANAPAVKAPANAPAANTPAAKKPAANTPAAKKPAAKNPAVKAPAAKKPAVKAPAANNPAAKNPGTKNPAAKKPAVKAPAAKNPAVKAPAANNPAADKPAADNPAVKAPAAKKPAVKAPAAKAPGTAPAANTPAANRHEIVVRPGHSVQAAVNSARPGDTVRLLSGTYTGGVAIRTDRITLRGTGTRTVLLPSRSDHCAPVAAGTGVCVLGRANRAVTGVQITDLTVHGFTGSGIAGYRTDRLRVERVTASSNGEYGIAEFGSTQGSLTHNRVIDNGEAGLYVGDAANANRTEIADNYASGNAVGVLVRHAHNVKVTRNTLTANCAGVALVDDGQRGGQGDNSVTNNKIARNNKVCAAHKNAQRSGGTGVVLMGGQRNTVSGNTITDNRGTQRLSGGLVMLPGMGKQAASGSQITGNQIRGNSPTDLIDRSGGRNAMQRNACTTSFPAGHCAR